MSLEWTVLTQDSVMTLPEEDALEYAVESAESGCICASPCEEYIIYTRTDDDTGDVVVQFHTGRVRLDSYDTARLSLGNEGVMLFSARSRWLYTALLKESSGIDLESLYQDMLTRSVAEIGPAFSEFIVTLAEDKAALREKGGYAPLPVVIDPLDYKRAGSLLSRLSGLAPGAQFYSPGKHVPLDEVVRRATILSDPEMVDWRKSMWSPSAQYRTNDLYGSLDYLLDIFAAGFHLCWHEDLHIEYVRSSMYQLLRPGGTLLQHIQGFCR